MANSIYTNITTTKRKDGRYMKRISINGKITPIYGHSHEEVVDKYLFMKQKQSENNLKTNSYTFETWSQKWLNLYKIDIQDTTKMEYSRKLEIHVYPKIGKIKLEKIKQIDIVDLLQVMDEKGLTKTKNEVLILIKAILESAIDNDLIYKNVAKSIKIKKHKSAEKTVISKEIIDCLKLHCHKDENIFMVIFLIYTGLRRGEITALTKQDIDLDNKVIKINKAAKFPHNQPVIKSTKNEETRYVPIFNVIYEDLKVFIKNKHEYIFTTKSGKPMTAVSLKRKLQSINTFLNKELNKHSNETNNYSITLHQTRHTFASILHEAGIDVKQAQKWTGHKDVRVLLDIYTHLDKNQNSLAIEKVNNFLN
ncbi:MAG: tyrosine-type recombinase/integrase [Clostridia bacterium]|jgi:integrase|nr:tyrosine-type recombinase/integrase [Clostridia bacterium]